MKTNYAVELQEMSVQEMREVNGGCCFISFLIKLLFCKPQSGGTDPEQPQPED